MYYIKYKMEVISADPWKFQVSAFFYFSAIISGSFVVFIVFI